jgi:hypothetical protein
MKPKSEFKPDVKLVIDPAKLESVILGLRKGDISECLVSEVKHAEDVLARVGFLAHIAPGFMDEMLAIFTPHFINQHNRAALAEMAQNRANEEGFGQEWREAIEAGKSPHQKDYLAKMVDLFMTAYGVSQAEAIRQASEQLGREEEDIRRSVTRSKKRRKNRA